MSSIVLQPGVKDMLLADCKDFLCSEEWYAERGIPFRRGYLLHGVPGSGKVNNLSMSPEDRTDEHGVRPLSFIL
jgi:hypothetical protein